MRTARLASVLALPLAAAALAAAGAAGQPTSLKPPHLPLTLSLPAGWRVSALTPGTRFDAAAADGSAHLEVTAGRDTAPFQEYVRTETASAKQHYRAQDPKASLRAHVVELPSGPALETVVLLRYGAPLAIVLFSILHGGFAYHFTYYGPQSLLATERPLFERSARSISFSS